MSLIALSLAASVATAGAVLVPAQSPQAGDAPALAEKADEIVRQRLKGAGVSFVPLFPDAGATAKAAPAAAVAKLKEGKDAYFQLRFGDAETALKEASTALLSALPSAVVFDAFAEAEAHRAATALAEGKTSFAEAALMRVLLRRPTWVADTAVFPPDFAQAFNRAKARVAALNRPRWEIVSEPALATVIVDGAPRGRTPLVLTDLPAGRHAVRVYANGRSVFTEDVLVKSEEHRLKVVLKEDPVASALAAYQEEVAGAGRLERVRALLGQLAKARGVDVAFAVGLLPTPSGPFVATVARVSAEQGMRRSASAIDASFTDAPDALEGAVARLLDSTGPALATSAKIGSGFTFDRLFFGRTLIFAPPQPTVATSTLPPVTTATAPAAPTPAQSSPASPSEEESALPLLLGGGAMALGGVAIVAAIGGGLAAAYLYDQNRGVAVPPYEVRVGGGVE